MLRYYLARQEIEHVDYQQTHNTAEEVGGQIGSRYSEETLALFYLGAVRGAYEKQIRTP